MLLSLPEELSVGRLPLEPASALCRRLLQCESCQRHFAHGLVGLCGHAFCSGCASLSPDGGSDRLWCDLCQSVQEADQRDVGDLLDKMKFACGCGLQGNLRQIRSHLTPAEMTGHPKGGEVCAKKSGEQTNGEAVAEQNGNGNFSTKLNEFKDRIGDLSQKIRVAREASTGISERLTGLEQMAGSDAHGVFWVNVRNLVEQSRKSGKSYSPIYRWTANGNPIGTQFIVGESNGEHYFGASHRSTHGPTAQWAPCKLLLGTKIYDLHGDEVEGAMTPTIKDGKPVSDAFNRPLPDYANGGYGPSNLIKLERLLDADAGIMTPSGHVKVVVETLTSLEGTELDAAPERPRLSWWRSKP